MDHRSQSRKARKVPLDGLEESDRALVRAAVKRCGADQFFEAFSLCHGGRVDAASREELEAAFIELADFSLTLYQGFLSLTKRPSFTSPDVAQAIASIQARQRGTKGGMTAAATTRAVREHALHLAKKYEPAGGWPSAPKAAEEIAQELSVFARAKGRNPSRRKVEEWLRADGIKRPSRTR